MFYKAYALLSHIQRLTRAVKRALRVSTTRVILVLLQRWGRCICAVFLLILLTYQCCVYALSFKVIIIIMIIIESRLYLCMHSITVERRFSGLIGTWPFPDMRITRIMSQRIYFNRKFWFSFEIHHVFFTNEQIFINFMFFPMRMFEICHEL